MDEKNLRRILRDAGYSGDEEINGRFQPMLVVRFYTNEYLAPKHMDALESHGLAIEGCGHGSIKVGGVTRDYVEVGVRDDVDLGSWRERDRD